MLSNFSFTPKFQVRFAVFCLLAGSVAQAALSPKWLVPAAAWIGPALLLCYSRTGAIRGKWGWMFGAQLLTIAVSLYEVAPFPMVVLAIITLMGSLISLAVFRLDAWCTGRNMGLAGTLFFPALSTAREFLESGSEQGVWGSIANSQYAFPWLAQLASVTGLWGISFLIYWFGSVAAWAVLSPSGPKTAFRGLALYSVVLAGVLLFGGIRYESEAPPTGKTLAVGGLTVSSLPFLTALHRDATGTDLRLDPKISQTAPEFQAVNRSFGAFIENPDPNRFRYGFTVLQSLHDQLFTLSGKAVQQGAKLVMWSEGNALVLKPDEPALLARGREFARKNRVYLLMGIASIAPGRITPDRKFLENQTVLIGPDGRIINRFFKNHPVPGVEPSRIGDGQIPAISTPYGRIAPSICYDADFPNTMRQLGRKGVGLLLLPSGDWSAISPYHSFMAVFRGIENGCSIARQVNGGLSLFTDYRGRIYGSRDFFQGGEILTVTRVPVQAVRTIYSRFGDWLAYLCLVFVAVLPAWRFFRLRPSHRNTVTETVAISTPTPAPANTSNG